MNITRETAELSARLAKLQYQHKCTQAVVDPLVQKLNRLDREINQLKSKLFIAENQITRDGVQLSQGDGMPWYGTVYEFGKWMRDTGCNKRWCEWNGRLYNTSDIIRGKMYETPALLEDVPE
jgi:hypothetical protein